MAQRCRLEMQHQLNSLDLSLTLSKADTVLNGFWNITINENGSLRASPVFATCSCRIYLCDWLFCVLPPLSFLRNNVKNTSQNPFGDLQLKVCIPRYLCAAETLVPTNLFHSNFIGGLIKWFYSFFRIRFLHDCISCVLHGARSKWAN